MNAVTLSGLKIRKALIQNIEDNAKDRNFLKMLFNFAQSMGFSAIIEGIETKAQIDFLKIFTEGKCPTYYISKPLALEAMQKLMLGFGTTK
ncbi:MAG: diguanylate cyclase/phosphodiesterase with PAS/PAC sensor(s) [uncultured bacterium]|nr:MAG: diguanylate cyclase/phosphodiesterase with PAS/PAC sensor(s) [uncultured bacterium]